jgi:hypothetical protein
MRHVFGSLHSSGPLAAMDSVLTFTRQDEPAEPKNIIEIGARETVTLTVTRADDDEHREARNR